MIAAGEIQKALIRVSELIVEAEPVLTEIDSIIGDGAGISFERRKPCIIATVYHIESKRGQKKERGPCRAPTNRCPTTDRKSVV